MRARPFALALVALLVNCAALEPLPRDTCGNGVIDANEDCDSFPSDQCGTPLDGPAQCHLRCDVTVKDAAGQDRKLRCPDGWGCGVENFCRAPSGEFEEFGKPFSAGVTRIIAGDFDGDKRGDLLGTNGTISRGRIHYGATTGDPQIVSLPGVLASPIVYNFNSDGFSDIAFGYTYRGPRTAARNAFELAGSDGLAVVLGQADRAVVTQPFPFLVIPGVDAVVLPVLGTDAEVPRGPPVTLIVKFDGSEILVSLADDRAPSPIKFRQLLAGQRVGDPIVAKVLEVATSTCGDIVLALDAGDASRIEIHSPCVRKSKDVVEWTQDGPLRVPIGKPISAFFVADIDRDTHQDLVVGIKGSDKVRVFYGTGTNFVEGEAPKTLSGVPLASGLINRGTRLDFVVSDGVLVSIDPADGGDAGVDSGADGGAGPEDVGPIERSTLQWTKVRPPSKKWTVAAIGDVNRDGAPDVVAGSALEADLDVLEGTLTRELVSFAVSTPGPVTTLGLSDFDFDGTADIVFFSQQPGKSEREIGISYGRVLTMPPEPSRIASRFEGIRQLFIQQSGVGVTSVVPSVVNGKATTNLNVSLLLKSTERQPVAPLSFGGPRDEEGPTTVLDRERLTRALVVAAEKESVDLVAFVVANDYDPKFGLSIKKPSLGVWVAQGVGKGRDATFNPPAETINLDGVPVVEASTDLFLLQMAAGDLGNPAGWTNVVVAPDRGDPSAASIFIIPPGGPAQTPGMMGSTQSVKGIEALPPPIRVPNRQAYADSRLQLLDLDGDDKLDIVTLLRDPMTKAPSLLVFFGEGNGAFNSSPLAIALPMPSGGSSRDVAPLDFTQITTAGASARSGLPKRRELVVVTTSQLYRVVIGTDRRPTVDNRTATFGNLRGVTAVVATDFNGDGVMDLAVADGSIRIARQGTKVNP